MQKLMLLIFCLANLNSWAQTDTTITLSLKEAQEYALKNNVNHLNSELDIESARKKIWETTAIGLPQVNGKADMQYLPGELPSIQFDPSAPPIKLGVKNSTTYSVTVSQLIFSGEYIVGLQASRAYLQMSLNNNEKTILDTKESAATSYLALLILDENLVLLDSSLLNTRKILDEMRKTMEQGYLDPTQIDQLEITLGTLENTRKVIHRQREVSERIYKIVLGISDEVKISLSQNLNDIFLELDALEATPGEFLVYENIDYKMMENQVQLSELSYKREVSKYLPSLAAFYMYQDKTNKATFDFTFNHILGISLSVPIFSSGQRSAKVSQAKIDLIKAENIMDLTTSNLEMSFNQLLSDYYNNLDKYELAKKNTELSKRILERSSIKFKEGMETSMDFTQANNQYLENLSNLSQVTMDLLKSKIALNKLYNKL